jgi:hypothetical protein
VLQGLDEVDRMLGALLREVSLGRFGLGVGVEERLDLNDPDERDRLQMRTIEGDGGSVLGLALRFALVFACIGSWLAGWSGHLDPSDHAQHAEERANDMTTPTVGLPDLVEPKQIRTQGCER